MTFSGNYKTPLEQNYRVHNYGAVSIQMLVWENQLGRKSHMRIHIIFLERQGFVANSPNEFETAFSTCIIYSGGG